MSLFGGVIPVTGITFLIFSVFAISAVGYALGRITIKGVSLGTAGRFHSSSCIWMSVLQST